LIQEIQKFSGKEEQPPPEATHPLVPLALLHELDNNYIIEIFVNTNIHAIPHKVIDYNYSFTAK